MKNTKNSTRRGFISLLLGSTIISSHQLSSANELRLADLDRENITRSILSMLASGRAYGKKLQKLVLNGLNLELWDLKKKVVYFSLPKKTVASEQVFRSILKEPSLRTEATLIGSSLKIEDRHLTRTNEKYRLYAVKYEDIYFDPDKILTLEFDNLKYSVTLMQLALFLRNDSIYGGRLRVNKVPEGMTKPKFLNHGALVTQMGEPTLTDLVNQIITGKSGPNEKIQALLDFVTEKIPYDKKEFYFGREFLQRFTETLISEEGDCSNKSILFSSMLEQIGVDYLMIYTNNHIYVAVEQDNFSNNNLYGFNFKNKAWTPAETTVQMFKIGVTKIKNHDIISDIKFIQDPKLKNQIFSYPDENMMMFN